MSIHGHRVFTDWIVGVLEGGGLNVGVAEAPATTDPLAGYVVVYSTAGGITRGSLEAPRSDAEPNVQINSVSLNASQVRWLADRCRTLIDAAVPATLSDGRGVIWLDFQMASPQDRTDHDVQPPKFTLVDRWEMGTA